MSVTAALALAGACLLAVIVSCAVGEGSSVQINRAATGVHVETADDAASAPKQEPGK
jgi:hypothetical protein